jgi:hypothetical protein
MTKRIERLPNPQVAQAWRAVAAAPTPPSALVMAHRQSCGGHGSLSQPRLPDKALIFRHEIWRKTPLL